MISLNGIAFTGLITINGAPIGQNLQNVTDRGNVTTNGLAIAGAAFANAPAQARNLVIGNGSAQTGTTQYTSQYAEWSATRTSGALSERLLFDCTGHIFSVYLNGNQAFVFDADIFKPKGSGTNLGGSAAGEQWHDFRIDGSIIHSGSGESIGLHNATPVPQHSSTGQTAGFTAGSGTGMNDDSTATGGVGTKAYTFGDIVKLLKDVGLAAAS